MDWGRQNLLAVALSEHVYLWDAGQGDITLLKKMEDENGYICSVSWSKDGNFLAVGTSDCKVEVFNLLIANMSSVCAWTVMTASLPAAVGCSVSEAFAQHGWAQCKSQLLELERSYFVQVKAVHCAL